MSEPVPVGVPPHQGAHAGEPRNADYGYDLTLICRPTKNPGGPWHVTGAVLKHGRDPATWLPGYVDPEFGTEDADTLLQYLEERHGGNGYTLDSLWYWINRPEDAPSLIDHYNQAIQFNGLNPSAAAVTPIVQATARGTESAVETVPNNSTLESRNASHDSEGAGFPTVRVVRVVRVGPPPWAAEFDSVDASELGGQPEWHFATPWLFQALASPTAYRPILAPPGPNDPLEHRCAYWTGAMYLLLYRLGWADPAAGLEWWRHAGYPSDDPTLRLIKATWLRDGRLSRLEPWLQNLQRPFCDGFEQRCHYQPRVRSLRQVDRDDSSATAPLGPEGLHLEPGGRDHLTRPFDGGLESGFLARSSPTQRRAVLVTDSMIGWYGALIEHGSKLPDIGSSSWHVDVFAKPVGFLGTFRRSRETGIWFTGRHSVHRAGT